MQLRFTRTARAVFATALTFSLLAQQVVLAPSAYAQTAPTPAQIEEAKKAFGAGRAKYDAGDKAGAVEDFKTAYKLSRNAVLLYNIAFVYDELGDKPLAVHYYEKFLNDAPINDATAGNRKLAEGRIPALKKEIADAEAGGGGTDVKPPDGGGDVKPPDGGGDVKPPVAAKLEHTVVEEVPPGKPIDMVAKIPEDSGWTLSLFYRTAGEEQFRTVRMKPRYTEIVGRIPAEAVKGSFLQYYIEVRDKDGKLSETIGRAASPNVIYIEPTAKPHYYEGESGTIGEDPDGDPDPLGRKIVPGGPDGPADRGDWFTYAKWGTTGSAGLFLTLSVVFAVTAGNNADALAVEAQNSRNPVACTSGVPPCYQFGGKQKAYQEDGKFYETMTNVSLAIGAASAVAAGAIWYLDYRDKKKAKAAKPAASPDDEAQRVRLFAAPVATEDYIGGAAVITF